MPPLYNDFPTSPLPEDDETWKEPIAFSGDFYREPDSVVRGVQFGNVTDSADPYREPDSVVRGVKLGHVTDSADFSAPQMGFDFYDLKGHAGYDSFTPDLGADCSGFGGKSFLVPAEPSFGGGSHLRGSEFLPSDEPPPSPKDVHWKFSNTTIHLETQEPQQGYKIGNYLLAFLRNEVVASILKMRKPSDPESNVSKFSIKAEVFICNIMCTMKIRVFKELGKKAYCVEFQRRSGDCVAFCKAYDQATAYLRKSMGLSDEETDEANDDAMCIDDALGMPNQDEITPLLDMAGMIHMPSLQADSASALAGLAKDRKRAGLLCTEAAFAQFKNLLTSNQTVIAYPIAQTLSSLADKQEAAPLMAQQGILQIIVEKVRSHATSALVQKHLLQCLSGAISNCLPFLSNEQVGALLEGLAAAAKAGPVRDGSEKDGEKIAWEEAFARNLQDTRWKVDSFRAGGGAGAAMPAQMSP